MDKHFFCEYIKKSLKDCKTQAKIEDLWKETTIKDDQKMMVSMSQSMHSGTTIKTNTETRLYENIVLATYTCDFGNVVINNVKKK